MSRPDKYKDGEIRHNNRAAIIAAAQQEFADNGFKGASMSDIASRAGLARPNVHYYFKNKQVLYQSVLIAIVSEWIELFDQIQADDEPAAALEAYIRAKLAYSRDKPVASRVFANELLRGAPLLKEYLDGEHRTWFKAKAKIINAWVKAGKIDPISPTTLMFMIWSTTQYYADFSSGVSSVYGRTPSKKQYQKIADEICQLVLKGCGLRPCTNSSSV